MRNLKQLFAGSIVVLALVSLGSLFPRPVSAVGCGGPYPPKPQRVWAKSGPGAGQVTLYWDKVNYANRYAVAYGTSTGNYQYGATNIGSSASTSYTVSGLSGGQYYFRIAAARDCSSSPFSDEVSAWSAAGGVSQNSWQSANTGSTPVSWTPASTNSNLSAWSGPGIGEVTVKWWGLDGDNYHIVYDKTVLHGSAAGVYKYGALNIGKTDHIVVRSLEAAQKYSFSIIPVGGSRSKQTIGPVSAVAKYPIVIETSAANIVQPVSMAEPEEVVPEDETREDTDEFGDVDRNDTEDELYEDDGNVQGMMEQSDGEIERSEDGLPNYNYEAENQTVPEAEEFGVGGPVDY